jgi:hypothetical protein
MNFSPPPDRIRDLCAKALKAQSPELEQIMKELNDALHEHVDFVRSLASHILKRVPIDPTEEDKPARARERDKNAA